MVGIQLVSQYFIFLMVLENFKKPFILDKDMATYPLYIFGFLILFQIHLAFLIRRNIFQQVSFSLWQLHHLWKLQYDFKIVDIFVLLTWLEGIYYGLCLTLCFEKASLESREFV